MKTNPPEYASFDGAIAAEVRAEFARQQGKKTLTELSDKLGLRRATLSARLNGHRPFTAGQLRTVAEYLGTTAEALTSEAERRFTAAGEAVA